MYNQSLSNQGFINNYFHRVIRNFTHDVWLIYTFVDYRGKATFWSIDAQYCTEVTSLFQAIFFAPSRPLKRLGLPVMCFLTRNPDARLFAEHFPHDSYNSQIMNCRHKPSPATGISFFNRAAKESCARSLPSSSTRFLRKAEFRPRARRFLLAVSFFFAKLDEMRERERIYRHFYASFSHNTKINRRSIRDVWAMSELIK